MFAFQMFRGRRASALTPASRIRLKLFAWALLGLALGVPEPARAQNAPAMRPAIQQQRGPQPNGPATSATPTSTARPTTLQPVPQGAADVRLGRLPAASPQASYPAPATPQVRIAAPPATGTVLRPTQAAYQEPPEHIPSPPTMQAAPPSQGVPGISSAREDLPGVTLEEVTNTALANSPQIREADFQWAAARGRAQQAALYPNPTFGTASPQLAGNQSQYNAYMIQDLVTKGKIRLDTSAAQRNAIEAELALVRARFDVLTMVRQRFYTALTAQLRVEVLEAMVNIARASTQIGQRLLEAQIGAKGDVLLLEIEQARAEAELMNAITLAETTKRQLAAGTGWIDMPIPRVKGDVKQVLPNYEVIAVQQGVIAQNALARSAEVEIGRTQFVLRRAQVEPFPNINFMGGYQEQQPGAQAPQNQALYQVQMVVPLWNRNQGNIRAAQAGVSTAVAQLNRVQTELANSAAAALGRYLTAQQLTDRYERLIVPNAVQLQSISQQLYKQGHIDFLRYLSSQRALLDASLAYISAQEARWNAAAEVAGLLQSDRFP